jgi:hypothetical protein
MCSNRIQRVFKAALLGVLGYVLYFGGTLLASFADSSISTSDSSWEVGSIAAFGLAASELFVLDSWALNKSLLRRLILSISIAIVSILIVGPMCMMIGIRQGRGALIWPKISMALLVFAFLTLYCRRVLLKCFNGNGIK